MWQHASLYPLRETHGRCYVTRFDNDNLTVPWRPLSLQEYLNYNDDTQRGFFPAAHLEDEIFRRCCLDETLVNQLPHLKAGIVSTVVQCIWQVSGPVNAESLSNDLEFVRQKILSPDTQILHQFVQLITMAFPYKPEEVYAMDYETLLIRTAQAERKLLEMKAIDTPLQILKPEEPKKKLSPVKERIKQRLDAKRLWEQQQKTKPQAPQESAPGQQDKWWNISPALEVKDEQRFDYARDFARQQEKSVDDDTNVRGEKQMVDDALWIYEDLIKGIAQKKTKK